MSDTNDDPSQPPQSPPDIDKDPDEWVTGDEAMTDSQRSYLETLRREAGEEGALPEMTKAEASKRIEELQQKTGRGIGSP